MTGCTHNTAIWQHLWERCRVVLWICPLTLDTSADLLIWGCKGPQQPLIVLCLCEGGVFIQCLWPKCLFSLGPEGPFWKG